MSLVFAKAVFYLSFLVFPFLAYFAYRLVKVQRRRLWHAFLVIGALVFTWVRFIEPQIIIVRETKLKTGAAARIALVADFHLGSYKGARFLDRVVQRLNALEVDAVLIAGDFVYAPDRNFDELFAPLKQLRHRAYAVLGNHDNHDSYQGLGAALERSGVRVIDNRQFEFDQFTLIALGDRWANNDDITLVQRYNGKKPLLVLTHNPDTALRLPPGKNALSLCGHTHGGQIRIPWLYKFVIPTKGDFDRGLYSVPSGRVFVTAGLGETALPLRFGVPPSIDVLQFQ